MKTKKVDSKGQIVLYKNKFEVKLAKETVWLTQKQMAELFDKERSVITRHIANIFKTKELSEKSNVQKIHIANSDKPIKFYNLDIIISVGYRVNSKRGTQFRIWANKVLKNHLVKGYTINQKLIEADNHKYEELKRALKLLNNLVPLESVLDQTKGIIRVICEYSRALDIIDRVWCKKSDERGSGYFGII